MLIEQAEHNAASAVGLEERRIEECVEQVLCFVGGDIARLARIHAVDVLDRDLQFFGILRMAETEHGLREFEADAHVDIRRVRHEFFRQQHEGADILVDGDVVVLGLGDDSGGLVDFLAVPRARRGLPLSEVVGFGLDAGGGAVV